ncbi:MAG: transporter [Candidatus Nezhaarchaeota archaeon]|nr:transporter [Candidatus Nezhaarchaeota archaeon]MCX8142368.1 transporter [Candidatus Nezhaarchaeota archaeon]MDW8050659.1 transporter [Nitrososphaerota archaeon]
MERDVAIIGVGMIRWGRYPDPKQLDVFPDKTMPEMAVEAIAKALSDAKISWRQVEAMVAGVYLWVNQQAGIHGILSGTAIANLMGYTGIPIVSVANACATGQSILREAALAVASGECDIALAVAADKSAFGFFRPQSTDGRADIDYMRFVMCGETNPAYWAMECRRRMYEAGTTEEDLALVKVVTSKPAPYNPYARYQRSFTLEEVLKSPIVCDPLRLYEICSTSDGAAAVIVCEYEKAKKICKKPVYINAVTVGTPTFGDPTVRLTYLSSYKKPGVPSLSESRNAVERVYRMAGITPDKIDLIELPDNSSWHYLAYLDCILNLNPGEPEKMLRRGDLDPITGKIPTCPSGGIGAFGEAVVAQGLAQVCELVWQLRGEAGQRQVKKEVKYALAQTYGYAGNNAATILSKGW